MHRQLEPFADLFEGNVRQSDVWPHELQPLRAALRRPGVTDVLINGPNDAWCADQDGLHGIDVALTTTATVRQAAVTLVALGGKHLDDSTPCVDVVTPDGFRVHAVLPPVGGDHAIISIRVPPQEPLPLSSWERSGGISPAAASYLCSAVAERLNILICGGTGSGKTTLLATLLGLVPRNERIITIEDVPELRIDHPHVIALRTRQANIERSGEITAEALVRESLRMRPDRLIVGECRGREFLELLTALNTGHKGGAGTVHANGIDGLVSRLLLLGALSGIEAELTNMLCVSAFDVVIEMRSRRGIRCVAGIGRLKQGRHSMMVERLQLNE